MLQLGDSLYCKGSRTYTVESQANNKEKNQEIKEMKRDIHMYEEKMLDQKLNTDEAHNKISLTESKMSEINVSI